MNLDLEGGGNRGWPDHAVRCHAKRLLKEPDRLRRSLIDSGVEQDYGERRWNVAALAAVPILLAIDADRRFSRQILDVQIRKCRLRYTPFRFTASVGGIIGIIPLKSQDEFNGGLEAHTRSSGLIRLSSSGIPT